MARAVARMSRTASEARKSSLRVMWREMLPSELQPGLGSQLPVGSMDGVPKGGGASGKFLGKLILMSI